MFKHIIIALSLLAINDVAWAGCGAIRNADKRYLCENKCGAIKNLDMRNACEGRTGNGHPSSSDSSHYTTPPSYDNRGNKQPEYNPSQRYVPETRGHGK